MPRVDLRAATCATMDVGTLRKARGTKFLFPTLVFLTGFLLTGAEIP